jgi:hypothetical protein
MPVSGVATMLKAFGLDPDEIRGNIEGFMQHMKEQGAKVEANQLRVETKLDAIIERLDRAAPAEGSSTPILENGHDTGVFVTSEKFPQRLIDDVNGA